jgi:very-short-patch-repair endonuclease
LLACKEYGTTTQKQINGDGRRTKWIGVLTKSIGIKEKKKKNEEEMYHKGFNPLECKLCGFKNMVSIITHVIKKHKISTNEYLQKFPNDNLYQAVPSVAIKTAEKLKKRHQEDPEFHQKIINALPPFPSKPEFWLLRGFSYDEAIQKVSESQKLKAHSGGEEKLKKLSIASSGKRNPMSLESIANRYDVTIEEAKLLTPGYGRVADKHPMWGKKHSAEAIEKIANSPHLKNPEWRSTGEIELANWCKSAFLCEIIENQKIGRWNVDILIEEKKLIVEYFGVWWHADPRLYSDDWVHAFTKKTAKEIRDKDELKIENLSSLGYNVIVIWESDWNNNPEEQKERIINAYNRIL